MTALFFLVDTFFKKRKLARVFLCFSSRSVARSELGKVALITGHISEGKKEVCGV